MSKRDKIKIELLDKWVQRKKVADIGCATGIYTDYLARKGKDVIGIELDKKLLSYARRKRKGKYLHGDIIKIPLKDKSVDTSILFDILEHVDDEKALEEVVRVTKSRIIGTVPRTTDKELRSNYLLFGHHLDQGHKRTYTKESVKQLLKRHNLEVKIIKPTHPISVDSLILDIFEGHPLIKRFVRKLSFTFLAPKKFYSNLFIVADLV